MSGPPVCCVTGLIAGDPDACGDCDPCLAAHTVPDVIKRLLAEKEEWRQKYGNAMAERDSLTARVAELEAERDRLRAALERIERWFGEFPATGQFWDEPANTQPMSYAAAFGSNGERDFMRRIASAALSTPEGGTNAE
jgi:hypothetical protein